MTTWLLVVRGVLSVVLGVAAVAKVRDRRGTADAAVALGVPERHGRAVAGVLPVVELAVAALLLVPDTARVGAAGAIVLLGAFTVAVARALSRGARPACHCFGQMSDEPIGPSTLVRNGVLLALAIVVLAGGSRADSSFGDTLARDGGRALDLLALAVVLGAVGFVVVLGDQQVLRRRLADLELATAPADGVAVGRPAPDFTLPDLDGRPHSLAELIADRPALLVFTDAQCLPCAELLPDLAEWSVTYENAFRIVVVAAGGREANIAKRDEHGLDVLVQRRYEVAEAYRYAGTPGAVLVGTDGRIAEPLASGSEAVRALAARAAAGAVVLPVGARAPRFHAHDTTGAHIDNEVLLGRMVVVLFWDETCSFCRAMEPTLWPRVDRFDPSSVVLLIVSARGGAPFDVAAGMRIIDDDTRALTTAFGSPGTPSAILLDAEGRVTLPMAVGAVDALALVDRALELGDIAAGMGRR